MFVLNVLNVANCYFFKCKSVIKVKNWVGKIHSFLDELGPFWWFAEKIGKFRLLTLKFSAFLGVKSNRHYIFQFLEEVKVMGRYIFKLFRALTVTGRYYFPLLEMCPEFFFSLKNSWLQKNSYPSIVHSIVAIPFYWFFFVSPLLAELRNINININLAHNLNLATQFVNNYFHFKKKCKLWITVEIFLCENEN